MHTQEVIKYKDRNWKRKKYKTICKGKKKENIHR